MPPPPPARTLARAVNLGQGFPDWETPPFVKAAAADAVMSDHNQYARSLGLLALVQQLAEHCGSRLGRKLDAATEVTVSVGATEGLFAAITALVNPGDEVVIFEPAYDVCVSLWRV